MEQLKKSKLFSLGNLKVAMELYTVVAYKMNNCRRADLRDICVSGYHCNSPKLELQQRASGRIEMVLPRQVEIPQNAANGISAR